MSHKTALHGVGSGSNGSPPVDRSLWLQQALADEGGRSDAQQLIGTRQFDVCVVGGGYVGLWTALQLLGDDPSIRVAIVEADICGGGASGRNTGQALPLWSKASTLSGVFGPEQAAWLARASEQAISEIEQFAQRRGADIGFRRSGWLWLASSASQLNVWDGLSEACAELGAEPFQRVDRHEASERTGSTIYRGGVFMPAAAMLHPARLARELRRAVLDTGGTVYEHSPVLRLDRERGTAETPNGEISASTFVIALGGWSGSVGELRRTIVPVSAEIIATEPISERLDRSGWLGWEAVTNARLTLRYTRRTDDGRAIFGRAGARVAYGARVGPKFHGSPQGTRVLRRELPRFVPAASGARITHSWAGPVDRSEDGLPVFGSLPGKRAQILYATGFSGNGVAPALLAAKSLSSLARQSDDEWSNCGFVNRSMGRFPPEPIRFLGGQLVRKAVASKEDREEGGRPVPAPLRTLSRLAPGGLATASKPPSSSTESVVGDGTR